MLPLTYRGDRLNIEFIDALYSFPM